MIIGLTGGIGCGKSTVAQLFRELNIPVIDSDQITRELVAPHQPALKAIVEHFGESILNQDGSLNRPKLRSLIFEFPEDRVWLENLLHPLAKEEILTLGQKIFAGHYSDHSVQKYIIVEIPLLIEAHFEHAVDRILVVDCNEAQQVERVARRDGVPINAIQAIVNNQTNRSVRLSKAHDVILNEGSKEELKAKVKALDQLYRELLNQKNEKT